MQLELSGIGQEHVLKKACVPVRVSNPNVGENLQEHFFMGSTFEVQDHVLTYDKLKDPECVRRRRAGREAG